MYGSDSRIPNQFDQVFDDDHGSALGFHAPIVKCTKKKRDKYGQSWCGHFGNERGRRQGFDASWDGFRVGHAFDESGYVRYKVGIGESRTERSGTFYSRVGDLERISYFVSQL